MVEYLFRVFEAVVERDPELALETLGMLRQRAGELSPELAAKLEASMKRLSRLSR